MADNIKMEEGWCGLDSCGSEQGQLEDFCDYCNEPWVQKMQRFFFADSRPILIASEGELFSEDYKISFLDLFNDSMLSASFQRQMARPLRKCVKKDVEENVSCLC